LATSNTPGEQVAASSSAWNVSALCCVELVLGDERLVASGEPLVLSTVETDGVLVEQVEQSADVAGVAREAINAPHDHVRHLIGLDQGDEFLDAGSLEVLA
jgi:hypothetical protein